jgi:hypothetical protein
MICAPGIKRSEVCFSTVVLKRFIRKVMHINKLPSGGRSKYVSLIQKYMKKKYNCNSETCWDKFSTVFKDEAKVVHKPDAGWSNSDPSVSNFDLHNTIKQYSDLDKDFLYLGDWAIDLYKIKKQKERFIKVIEDTNGLYKYRGIIIYFWGKKIKLYKHWACIVLNDVTGEIQFMESNADEGLRIDILPIIELIKNHTGNLYTHYVTNVFSIQIDDINCGIFCIDFMINMKDGMDFKKYIIEFRRKQMSLPDNEYIKYVNSLREKYFIISS